MVSNSNSNPPSSWIRPPPSFSRYVIKDMPLSFALLLCCQIRLLLPNGLRGRYLQPALGETWYCTYVLGARGAQRQDRVLK